jgi:hypothetical protein
MLQPLYLDFRQVGDVGDIVVDGGQLGERQRDDLFIPAVLSPRAVVGGLHPHQLQTMRTAA